MYLLTYTSSAKVEALDLDDILEKARKKNAAQGVTGLLILRSGMFFQLLEGTKGEVLRIFQKISADPRHDNIKVLFEVEIDYATRIFPSWQMGAITRTSNDVSQEALIESLQSILKSDSPPRNKILQMLREISGTMPKTSAQQVLDGMARPGRPRVA